MEKATRISKITYSQTQDLKKVITEYRVLFARRPGKTSLIKNHIELTEDTPVQAKPCRLAIGSPVPAIGDTKGDSRERD